MEFSVKFVKDGVIYENIWNIRAQYDSGGGKILAAAQEFLNKKFGQNTTQVTNHTLLRVRSPHGNPETTFPPPFVESSVGSTLTTGGLKKETAGNRRKTRTK